uniref:Putative sigma-70 region domain containing protein n=1 Tax=viral metagenome TaxID=1070528 RepID=A0A6M3IQ04_9ZZZZ
MIEWADILKRSGFKDPQALLQDRYLSKGLSMGEIALEFRVTLPTIRNYLKRLGVPTRGRGGDNSSKAVDISLEEYRSMTYAQLAEKYGVSEWMVWSRTRGFPPKRGGGKVTP